MIALRNGRPRPASLDHRRVQGPARCRNEAAADDESCKVRASRVGSAAPMNVAAALGRHRALVLEFLRFAVVGTVSFVVTTAMVYALRGVLGPALAGIPSYLAAATVSWALNRTWTFKGKGGGPLLAQWARFLVASGPGLLVNTLTYEALVLSSTFVSAHPILATAGGAVVGLFVNFAMMRQVVFRSSGRHGPRSLRHPL